MRLANVRRVLEARKHQFGSQAARQVEAALKANAPRASGQLADSIKVRAEVLPDKVILRAETGDLIQAKTTEEGARPHVIRPVRAKALSFYWPKVGRRVSFAKVNHPGNPPRPWFRPTIRDQGRSILASVWRSTR